MVIREGDGQLVRLYLDIERETKGSSINHQFHSLDGALAGVTSLLVTQAPAGTHVHFAALECFQEKLTDLQTQRSVEFVVCCLSFAFINLSPLLMSM